MSRILGIVGGTGPESTVDYYRTLIAEWRRRRPDGTFPRVIIDSVEGSQVIRWLGEREFERVGEELGAAVTALAAAGAGAALLASNASHLAFAEVAARSPLPLIHIVDAARDAAIARGHRRLAIFGTRFVMESRLYQDRFGPAGITIVVPDGADRTYIHDVYLGELVMGVFRDETRDRLVAILTGLRDRERVDALILGGTELALILPEPTYADVPILNTAKIHVEAAVDWLLGDDAG
jgi:aspartate racemase